MASRTFFFGVKGLGGVFSIFRRTSSSFGGFAMRPDLAYAQASLDWAISNLPSLEERLNLWCKDNIKTIIVKTQDDVPNDVIVAVEKSPFPLAFSAEAGAYINAIRSSLDVLAWAIFKRDLLLHPDEVYFPVAGSEADWKCGNYKGSKFISQLGGTERSVFESLKPYKGGNEMLYFLHHLDITRKHTRLLNAGFVPQRISIIGNFKRTEFTPLNHPDGFVTVGNGETILGLWAKSAAKPKLHLVPEIFVTEPELELNAPIMPLLGELARHTEAIIKAFDY